MCMCTGTHKCVRVCERMCISFTFIFKLVSKHLTTLFSLQPFIHQLGSEVDILPTDNNTTCLFLFADPISDGLLLLLGNATK